MKKIKNEVVQKHIVVKYYCAKWGIKNQNIVQIQFSDLGEKVTLKIETNGVMNGFRNRTKLNTKGVSSSKVKSDPAELLKKRIIWWSLLYFIKLFLGKSFNLVYQIVQTSDCFDIEMTLIALVLIANLYTVL
mgnify:CR=1 FL=1